MADLRGARTMRRSFLSSWHICACSHLRALRFPYISRLDTLAFVDFSFPNFRHFHFLPRGSSVVRNEQLPATLRSVALCPAFTVQPVAVACSLASGTSVSSPGVRVGPLFLLVPFVIKR